MVRASGETVADVRKTPLRQIVCETLLTSLSHWGFLGQGWEPTIHQDATPSVQLRNSHATLDGTGTRGSGSESHADSAASRSSGIMGYGTRPCQNSQDKCLP